MPHHHRQPRNPDDEDGLIVNVEVYQYAVERLLENAELVGQMLEIQDQIDAVSRGGMVFSETLTSLTGRLDIEEILKIAFPDRTFPEDDRLLVAMTLMRFLKRTVDSDKPEQ